MHEIEKIEKNISELEFSSMFRITDNYNAYLDIQSGSGGIDAQDWARILLRLYFKWGISHNFFPKIIESTSGDIAGIKSATIYFSGNYAYGWLKTETGIHRLVRKSPFNSLNRRHTSFASIFVSPDISQNKKLYVNINLSDLRIDTYRSKGAGGQHVNRTDSAVRITHLPTNTVVQCQNNRSQHQNKSQALKQLQSKLYAILLQKKSKEKENIEKSKLDICWGNQIRSYILDQSRVKDLKTGIETKDVQSVLNGNIDQFIKASLKEKL